MRPNRKLLLVAFAALMLIGFVLRSRPATDPAPTSVGGSGAAATASTTAVQADELEADPEAVDRTATSAPFSNLPTVAEDELPIEAIDTLLLIDDGGPYPFDRDDLIFQNREGILPDRPPGHYREYTVITPGEGDRGAKRVVAGADGERYYSNDHYRSFREIEMP